MNKKKKKLRWHFQIFLRNVVIVVLVAFIIYSIYVNVTKTKTAIFQVSYENVALETEHRALLMRRESIVNSYNSGLFTPLVADGERVKKGQIVGELQIADIERDDATVATEDVPIIDEDALQKDIDLLYNKLVVALRDDNHILATTLKADLDMKLDRLKKLIDANSDSAYQDSLQSIDTVGQADAENGQIIKIPANMAGIVSYYFDGYENTVAYQNRYKIDYATLFDQDIVPSNQSLRNVYANSSIFKIVSNVSWYLACEVELKDIDNFKKNAEVRVGLKSSHVKARIDDVFQAGNKGVLIIEMLQYVDGIHTLRTIDVDLMRDEVRGIKVPNSAIVKRADERGVYVVDINKALSFAPIKVLAEGADFVVVQEGSFQIETAEGQLVRRYSLNHGDKIVAEATDYKEGDIVE